MPRTLAALLTLALAAPAPAQSALAQARQRWLRGNYAEAEDAYLALVKAKDTADAARFGLSRVYEATGEYDRALAAVDEALAGKPNVNWVADLHARRAELLHARGRTAEAEKAVAAALAVKTDHFRARWVLSLLLRDRGEVAKALAELRWVVRTYSDRNNADNTITDPDELLLVALAGADNARWNDLADQFRFVLTEVLADARKSEKGFWPAEHLAGVLLMEKSNRPDAAAAFDKALAVNPRAAPVLAAKGQLALQGFDVPEAEDFADQALAVNPNLPEALRLKADVLLAAGDPAAALKQLDLARKVNDHDEATLARVAACLTVLGRAKEADAVVAAVEARNPKAGGFYTELARQIEERKFFELAGKLYRKAVSLGPDRAPARNALGLLELRLGREDDARKTLTAALESDPFNFRVDNALRVLRHLEGYETVRTAHFDLRFDPKRDAALARFLAEYLEEVYRELAKQFAYEPPGRILVELFNNHQMFSGRIVGVPDLYTVGACTGRTMAMVSPQGKGLGKPFNWGRVVRHELVHIFNLEQTNFLVPHWLTEGLAVRNEGYPRPRQWDQVLRERAAAGRLLTLDTITNGFVRPRSPGERPLAYCQSLLYVEYLAGRFGPDAAGRLLAAYARSPDTAAALKEACKVEVADFEKGYAEYVQRIVKTIPGRPAEVAVTFAKLQELHAKAPDDADTAARLAEQYMRRRKAPEARRLVDGVLVKRPDHPLANLLKARLLKASGDEDGAKRYLEAGAKGEPPDPRLLLELGKLYFEAKQFDQAAAAFERGKAAAPLDGDWVEQLAAVYAHSGQKANQTAALEELTRFDPDDLPARQKLAKLLLEAGRSDDAERVARDGLLIDVTDTEVRNILYAALAAQRKDAELVRLKKLLEG